MPTWWAVDDPQTRLSPWFSSTWPTTSDRQHHYRHESLWWASPGGLRWLFVQIIRRTKPLLAPTFSFLCWYKMERFVRSCVEKRFHSFMIVKPKTCDLLCFSLVWAISPLSSHSDGVPYRGHVYVRVCRANDMDSNDGNNDFWNVIISCQRWSYKWEHEGFIYLFSTKNQSWRFMLE